MVIRTSIIYTKINKNLKIIKKKNLKMQEETISIDLINCGVPSTNDVIRPSYPGTQNIL